MIVIFSGSSGVGKNTVINELLKNNSDYSLMPTFTTRSPREGEVEGNPYFFVSNEKFEKMIKKNKFYEYESIHGKYYYGTPKKIVDKTKKTKQVFLKDIDVLGAINLKKLLKDKLNIITIYLHIDKETLKNRLEGRGEKDIVKRLERFDFEFSHSDKYDYFIENVSLDETVKQCKEIIEKSK